MDVINDVAELKRLHSETEVWINKTLASLGWTRDNIHKDEDKKQPCSIDPGHVVAEKTRAQHEYYCSRARSGYSREELHVDQSSKFFYEKATTVVPVTLDDATLRSLLSSCSTEKDWSTHPLPLTSQRYLSVLTCEERRSVYDYCVATAKATNKIISFPKEELMFLEDQDNKTDEGNKDVPRHLLQLMQERDMKRKRQKYRAKNVHITQKSHTEIIREVLVNQMELLHRRWNDEDRARKRNNEKDENVNSQTDVEHSRKGWSHRSSDKRRHSSRERQSDSSSRKRHHRSMSCDNSTDRHRSHKHKHKHHKHKHHRHSRRHDDHDNHENDNCDHDDHNYKDDNCDHDDHNYKDDNCDHDDHNHKDDNRDHGDRDGGDRDHDDNDNNRVDIHDDNSSFRSDFHNEADEKNSLKMCKKEDFSSAVKNEKDG